ncbi:DUF2270 domain-containing protein [Halobellus ruber]|uniref:DUF2270 domain-containing protein n=1 Tax=Halobellus ruber TaxID=2761102 RepID=A0A7J9SKV4_9EURY|nr:DUF2270 domain-containing protein [Halobellus ruber]MBB6645661.1 DUF2270 domain-containing protein [Halobellus ruber]
MPTSSTGTPREEASADDGDIPAANPEAGTAERPDPAIGQGLLDTEMGPSSAMAHLYRGEIHRMKFWRERLDRTTNWAVIVLAAVLTWAFSTEGNPHYLLLIGNVVLATFLTIEARRYRAYDIWRTRVRTLQKEVWAAGLDGSGPTDSDWRARLADDYREPTVKITTEEAVAHRLRRIYLPLFAILNAAWVVRITAFGTTNWPRSAAIGMLPGTVVTVAVGITLLGAIGLAFRPRTWHAYAELRTEELRRDDAAD